MSRLRALSDAHALVFEANWRETDIEQVLRRTLAPFRRDGDRSISMSGPTVKLEPKAALALSLIFHELVTNAVKYGALSRETGRVTAAWRIEPNAGGPAMVSFDWRESGGPAVSPPRRSGFGTNLIERSARYELDGDALLRYPEDGFCCELRFSPTQD